MSGLMKSSVTLFQPILQPNVDGSVTSMTQEDVAYHLKHAWPGRNGLGPLCRQFLDQTVEILSDDPLLEFDSITLAEARRAIDLGSQAYSLQNESIRRDPATYDDGTTYEGTSMMKAYTKENTLTLHAIRNMQ